MTSSMKTLGRYSARFGLYAMRVLIATLLLLPLALGYVGRMFRTIAAVPTPFLLRTFLALCKKSDELAAYESSAKLSRKPKA